MPCINLNYGYIMIVPYVAHPDFAELDVFLSKNI